ncbi:MAG: type II toxin-antitoxin system HicA family toxin [Nitrospirota bacterium]
MTPPLPVVSGKEVIRALEKIGYVSVRQKGSHVRLIDDTNPEHKPVTVPLHKEIDKGLLRAIIRDANITLDDFMRLL